jgi:hydroxymethylglutaryl-CoA reductase
MARWIAMRFDPADLMIENVVGVFCLPISVALNFIVNTRVLVPMAVEAVDRRELPSPKLSGRVHGITTWKMIGQMQLLDVPDLTTARLALLEQKTVLLAEAGEIDQILKRLGGGPRDLEVRILSQSPIGPFLVLHLIYDVRDAMGANAVNTACERLAPRVEAITGGVCTCVSFQPGRPVESRSMHHPAGRAGA